MAASKNPEMFFLDYSHNVQSLAFKIRMLLLKTLPEIIEEIDLSAKMVAYVYGKRYADMICTIIPSKKGIKLGFYRGVDLGDPNKILKGSGKISRYVEINSKNDINTSQKYKHKKKYKKH